MEGNPICEARDRQHYQIAAGIHPAASILGTDQQKQDLSESLALKKRQASEAKSGIKQMVESIILPEARNLEIQQDQIKPVQEKKAILLTSSEKEAIEAAKHTALAEDGNSYVPSLMKHWADEPARYEYLWTALYEHSADLVAEDAAFMEAFEQTRVFQTNYKSLYESKLELMNFRKGQCAAIA